MWPQLLPKVAVSCANHWVMLTAVSSHGCVGEFLGMITGSALSLHMHAAVSWYGWTTGLLLSLHVYTPA